MGKILRGIEKKGMDQSTRPWEMFLLRNKSLDFGKTSDRVMADTFVERSWSVKSPKTQDFQSLQEIVGVGDVV